MNPNLIQLNYLFEYGSPYACSFIRPRDRFIKYLIPYGGHKNGPELLLHLKYRSNGQVYIAKGIKIDTMLANIGYDFYGIDIYG